MGQLTTLQPLSTDINELTHKGDILRTIKFLSDLDPAYESFRHQIISQPTLPNMNEAFSRIQNVDAMLSQSSPVSSDSAAFAFANGVNHLPDKCLVKFGKLDWAN